MCDRELPKTWLHLYSTILSRTWTLVPQWLSSCLVTLAVFALGITARGEWLLVGVHVLRQYGGLESKNSPIQEFTWSNITLDSLRLKDLPTFWLACNGFGYIMYFLIGGFLHWYFYMRQRDRPEDWKCQAKWLTPELERHEIMYGSVSLIAANTFTSILACYIANGGYSTLYYKYDQFSWLWYFCQWPVIFCYQDYTTYWLHRLYHTPWLYKRFHKAHHKYVQPTAFSVTAIHPFELVHIQMTLCLPIFVIPTHWSEYSVSKLIQFSFFQSKVRNY
ncbi:hypothetical protein J6590_041783 [Homalodisca vitripennis]|nr:hypothetical protein J6590_041783 [Homalodisca vitripennis]